MGELGVVETGRLGPALPKTQQDPTGNRHHKDHAGDDMECHGERIAIGLGSVRACLL